MKDYVQATGYSQLVTSSDCIGSFSATTSLTITAVPVIWAGGTISNTPSTVTL